MIRLQLIGWTTFAALFSAPILSFAALIVPPGLLPGDTYHLVFVTRGQRDATSSDINDYNAFVQLEANLNPVLAAISWKAIASTFTVDARDNAVVSAPVYRLDGVNIASGFADLWDGALNAPILLDQFMVAKPGRAWTGTQTNGTKQVNPIRHALGGDFPGAGITDVATASWIHQPLRLPTELNSLYALSQVLTVVPEPSGWLLAVCGALAFWLRRRT